MSDAQLREAFDLFDSDSSGYVDENELLLLCRGMGHEVSQEEVREMMGKIDQDGDFKIDFDEFKQLISNMEKEMEGPKQVLEAFKAFDISHTGEISRSDLKEVALSLGERVTEQEVEEIWQFCAANDTLSGEPKFSFFAWSEIMQSLSQRGADGEKVHALPDTSDPAWAELAEQEETDRAAAIEKKRIREEEIAAAKEKAAAQKLIKSKWREQDNSTGKEFTSVASAHKAVSKLAARKALRQRQAEEAKAAEMKKIEEETALKRKLEEKKKSAVESYAPETAQDA
eukprot:TRINITY_DN12109_c0_g1_i1.p1 TRINITY_DN12109_c0_g1~~TRINITY_DN12109_c0_g1_i1.p1  ORF type:complete len:285 (+),score=95.25 TRINITY_DN12109_c0_g1_i1:59-913(+)